jgi:hypothetical protein
MYRSPSKRKQLVQRTIVYVIMSIAVAALVTLLVFVMLGYQFNRSDGKIEQGGLVQFDSKPNGASITIDGMAFGARTPSKTTMIAGQHFITMEKSGYRTWQKSVDVTAGSVLWLSYARLIPSTVTPTNVAQFATVSNTAASPDDKWMAIKEDPATPAIVLNDVSQDVVTSKTLELPATSYTHPIDGKNQAFTFVSWDADSRYLLVKHAYDTNSVEWLVVDTQNVTNTKNISTLLGIAASKAVFSGSNANVLYALIGSDMRKIDLNAATLSRPLVTNVADFSLYDNTTITYTTLLDGTTKARTVGYYQDGADAPHAIRSYTDDGQTPLKLAVSNYFGDTYEVIAYGDTVEILKGSLPTSAAASSSLHAVATMNLPGGAQYLSIETDGRFVIAQNAGTFETYDIELQKVTKATLKGSSEVTSQLQWLDGYTVWSDRDGMARMYEFDGTNQQDIMSVSPGFSLMLSPNGRYMYGIIKSADGVYHLERAVLVL